VRIHPSAKTRRHAATVGCALALAVGLAACGNKVARPTYADANNNGAYLWAGQVTYQLQVSRELNPYNIEDRQYLTGVSSIALPADEEWYAVFLWAWNQTKQAQTTANSFDIVDTQGNRYYPVALSPTVNPFAWSAQTLPPKATEPAVGSIAYYGANQGAELLFKINDSVYSNRPLMLEIHAPGQSFPSTIALDI